MPDLNADEELLHEMCKCMLNNRLGEVKSSDYRDQYLWGVASRTPLQKLICNEIFSNYHNVNSVIDLHELIECLVLKWGACPIPSVSKLLIAIVCGIEVLRKLNHYSPVAFILLESQVPLRIAVTFRESSDSTVIKELTGLNDSEFHKEVNRMVRSYRKTLPDGKGDLISTEDAIRIFMYSAMKGTVLC